MDHRPNLILVGFMGAGKSTVGQEVATRLNLLFVDSDVLIEAKAGKSIPEIFAAEGEKGFRRRERDTLTQLSAEKGLVIATGGGAFMDDELRSRLMANGVTVYLQAPFSVLWKRVGHSHDRPLLAGDRGRERAEELFLAREPIYEQAHVSVNVDRPYEEVVGAVVEVYREHTQPDHR